METSIRLSSAGGLTLSKYHSDYIYCSPTGLIFVHYFLITVLAVELAKELEEYGLKCSLPKYEDKADYDAESDGVSTEVCIDFALVM